MLTAPIQQKWKIMYYFEHVTVLHRVLNELFNVNRPNTTDMEDNVLLLTCDCFTLCIK